MSAAHVLAALIAAALLWGCDHTPPFESQPPVSVGPRVPGNPARLTYNPGADLRPSWLPDGSGFYYSLERTDRADGDRCLALMAQTGGTVLEQICDRSVTSDDSIATFESAAVAADGRLAYLRAGTPLVPATLAPRTVELRLGTRAAPAGGVVRAFPYTASSGRIHQSLAWLQWRSDAQLVYLAEEVRYASPCPSCPPDTLRIGIEVVRLDAATGVLAFVPGTDSASSVAVAGSDTIYYTRPSSNVILRRILSSGVVSTAATFLEPVRDVAAGGGRLVAITGAGSLWLVEPGVNPFLLGAPGPRVYQRPALSPDGQRIVVEGYAVLSPITVSRSADLWLFDLP